MPILHVANAAIFFVRLAFRFIFLATPDRIMHTDSLDADMDDKITFPEFADLFEPTIESYERKGRQMDVSSATYISTPC